MCQLLALSSNAPTDITFSFTGLSARGGRTGPHGDGFGLAFYEGRACRVFVDPGRAADAPLADFLRREPIHATHILAHVRKATQGPVAVANCHPFVREWQGRQWSFIHNGDLKDFHPRLSGRFLPVGDTESERAFCWILQQLQRRIRVRRQPAWQQIGPVLAELAGRIARHGSFNFVLSDGEALYAHASTRLYSLLREHPYGQAQLVDEDLALDLTGTHAPGDRQLLLATEPLTRDEPWQPFAPGELRVIAHGQIVWQQLPTPDPSAWVAPVTASAQAVVAQGERLVSAVG